jgi:hypothetical protein
MGMQGGQWIKGVRRFGIPGISVTFAAAKDIKDKKLRWRLYLLSTLSFLLAMGYGENSIYTKVFKKDWLVRIMYGLTLSIPFLVINWRVGLASMILLPGAWSLRLGKFKIYKDFDFLWEDFARYTTLGCIIAYTIGG